MTVEKDILVGCADGLLILFDSTSTRSISDPASLCSGGYEHGEIIGLQYNVEGKILVIGFSSGKVHIKICTQGIRNSLFGQKRDFCTSISNGLHMYALECVSSESANTLEVWCGSEGSRIEVWSLPIGENLTWTHDTVVQHQHSIRARTGNPAGYDEDMVVTQMKQGTGLCETMMVALLHKKNTTVIAFVDMESKEIEKTVECNHSSRFCLAFTLITTLSLMDNCYSVSSQHVNIWQMNLILKFTFAQLPPSHCLPTNWLSGHMRVLSTSMTPRSS